MNTPEPTPRYDAMRIEHLISAHFNGALVDSEQAELDAWLTMSSEARRAYWEYAAIEAGLIGSFRALKDAPPQTVMPLLARREGIVAAAWNSTPLFAALLFLAMGVGSLVTWQVITHQRSSAIHLATKDTPNDDASEVAHPYTATLVRASNCRWDLALNSTIPQRGGALRPGESLHLLEGIAEVQTATASGHTTTLQLEGPLALTFTNTGMPNLFYGKITGNFLGEHDQYALDTPLGRIIVSGNTSIGVLAAANQVELHVFSGSATLKLWTMGLDEVAEELTAVSGASLRVSVRSGGGVDIDRAEARESWFVTPKAIAESQLSISREYVDAVKEANPVAYWRFEQNAAGVMRNEMSDRLHCRMVGDAVRWRMGQHGSSVEFGVAAGPGYLISDDSLDGDLKETYSLELWAKPTYYHHGTLFSLIDWIPSQSPLGTHRMALELCGPVTGFTSPYRLIDSTPGRIRFIHEVRKSFDAECFSPAPYAVRRWQHITAVKDIATLRLYVDGELVRTEEAAGGLAPGLRVLMGQLFPESPQLRDEVTSRLFGGELDEVAIYGQALSEAEIKRHVQLARPNMDLIQPSSQ